MTVAAVAEGAGPTRGGTALKLHRVARFGEVSNADASRQAIAKPDSAADGTGLAVIYLRTGGAANCAAQASRRGGARNHSGRVSHALTSGRVANLLAAAGHANVIGLPLNRMTTIHWEAAGVQPAGMVKATGRFTDLFTRWIARKRHRTAWVVVHENGPGKGAHCHLLVHVPPALVKALTGQQRAWLRRITGQPYRKRVIRSRPVGDLLGLETRNPALHSVNLAEVLGYLVKGADATAAAQHGLLRLDGGGPVIGRRCSTSQNIGAKARKGNS